MSRAPNASPTLTPSRLHVATMVTSDPICLIADSQGWYRVSDSPNMERKSVSGAAANVWSIRTVEWWDAQEQSQAHGRRESVLVLAVDVAAVAGVKEAKSASSRDEDEDEGIGVARPERGYVAGLPDSAEPMSVGSTSLMRLLECDFRKYGVPSAAVLLIRVVYATSLSLLENLKKTRSVSPRCTMRSDEGCGVSGQSMDVMSLRGMRMLGRCEAW
ncbi:hypothetical protein M427DRAFT_258816 [Gonapodya prolifera JEL478]|uniref:Uncharacterized protein n=1 Tax=Gonapodya prolifera (strain JEL478) TaxID=1344416 RepID=A0A138ZX34_GONPJ|nr:hypothetical protein M427DRAFT_258816 [Gonapodya prolifera JEL478]|eukprot:KXS09024.1 hypothetical protein M427DRAFT_258816 [Gonapodya prolifera JEL478]